MDGCKHKITLGLSTYEVKVYMDMAVRFLGSRAEYPEEGGSRILRNVDTYLPGYTIITFRKTVSS
jgi:hypothetical protein